MKVRHLFVGGALALTATVAHANLLVNGSFETGDFTGWTTVGGEYVVPSGFENYSAQDGAYFVALGNVGSDGEISQTFADTAGTSYTLSFYLAGDDSAPSDFSAYIDGSQLLYLSPVPSNGGYQTYIEYSYSFTGTGSDTVSFFARNDPAWDALDNVSVDVGGVPEPATWALMLLGVGATGFGLRRRSRTRFA